MPGVSKHACGKKMAMLELEPRHLGMVKEILAALAPEADVWAYGSRVSGECHDGSDLDLVLRNPENPEKETGKAGALREAFSECDIPILVDVVDWALIPPSFREEITERYEVLQGRSA